MKTKIECQIVWNEQEHKRIPHTPILTGIIVTKFDTLITYQGKSKVCYCALESTIFYPELKYSLQ